MKIQLLLFILILPIISYCQYLTISGKVYDKNTQEPLPGASVFILGTSWGTSTDLDGNFKITNIKKGTYDIVISYIGYHSDTIKNTNYIQITIHLKYF